MGRARSEPNRGYYAVVGRKIADARRLLGMTQEALALKISLSRTSVINIEKGRQQLLVHTLVDIARALHVAPSDLIPEFQSGEPKDITSVLEESGVPEKGIDWLKAAVVRSSQGSS